MQPEEPGEAWSAPTGLPSLASYTEGAEIHVPTGGRQAAASIALGSSTEQQAGISGVKSESSDIHPNQSVHGI